MEKVTMTMIGPFYQLVADCARELENAEGADSIGEKLRETLAKIQKHTESDADKNRPPSVSWSETMHTLVVKYTHKKWDELNDEQKAEALANSMGELCMIEVEKETMKFSNSIDFLFCFFVFFFEQF